MQFDALLALFKNKFDTKEFLFLNQYKFFKIMFLWFLE